LDDPVKPDYKKKKKKKKKNTKKKHKKNKKKKNKKNGRSERVFRAEPPAIRPFDGVTVTDSKPSSNRRGRRRPDRARRWRRAEGDAFQEAAGTTVRSCWRSTRAGA